MSQKNKYMFYRCCYGYAVSGMAVLVIGAILPSLIAEMNMSFLAAGGLLSVMAIGNLLASFVYPVLERTFGRRWSIGILASAVPVCFMIFTILPPMLVLYGLMTVLGISRGAITIINNAVTNQISNNSTKMLNLLHCSFAVGAFLSPLLTALFLAQGWGWRQIIYLISFLCLTSAISYATMTYEDVKPANITQTVDSDDRGFLKASSFYIIGFLLFFYIGIENCVNGWFVTYLQNTGVMSGSFATTLVSFTWLVIMAGRLVCASLSKRFSKENIVMINCFGASACFLLLIATKNLGVITISLMGLGFFLAGIYPTCIANAGETIKGSTWGLSLLTAIASVGGILTPQLVGGVADKLGIVAAIGILVVNAGGMVILSVCNIKKQPFHKRNKK